MDSKIIHLAMDAVIARHAALFPEWELGIIALHKKTDRNAQIDKTIALLQSLKEQNPDADSFAQKLDQQEDFVHPCKEAPLL